MSCCRTRSRWTSTTPAITRSPVTSRSLLQTLGLPLILAMQGPADEPEGSSPIRSVFVAGAVVAVAVVPLLFSIGLGSPR